MRTLHLLLLVASLSACATPTPGAMTSNAPPAYDPFLQTSDGDVLVTQAPSLGRPCEVIGVVDLHLASSDPVQGFAELRRNAAALGGNAVVSAHFESGAGNGPAHVFGVVVRSKAGDPRPYDVIAELDAQSADYGPDKGFEALRARARELGADRLVDVRFEHSETGVSHLRARAVRYRR